MCKGLGRKIPKDDYKRIRQHAQERKAHETVNEQKLEERICPSCGQKGKIRIDQEFGWVPPCVVVSCKACRHNFEDYRLDLSDLDYYHSFLDNYEEMRAGRANLTPIERRKRSMERRKQATRKWFETLTPKQREMLWQQFEKMKRKEQVEKEQLQ